MLAAEIKCQNNDTTSKTRYGLELSQFLSQSGFAPGTELSVIVLPDRIKNLSLGINFCPESKKFTGIIIHHERTLMRNTFKTNMDVYAFYNMVYRVTKTQIFENEEDTTGEYHTFKSIEHYVGIGLNITIAKDLYFKSAIGYGGYLGSIEKSMETDSVTGKVRGSNGFGAMTKISITYIL